MSLRTSSFVLQNHLATNLLRWGCALMLLGRSWQHFFWETPYHALLAEGQVPQLLQIFCRCCGGVYALAAAAAIFPKRVPYAGWWLLGSAWLLVGLFAASAARQREITQLLEHAAQISIPIWLWIYFDAKWPWAWLEGLVKAAVALTFVSHGLYALGFPYPQPGNFIFMAQQILQLAPDGASAFLTLAGVFDILASALLFSKKWEKPALAYMVIWGALTALARIVVYFDPSEMALTASRWGFEVLVRMPHALLPLFLLAHRRYSFYPETAEEMEKFTPAA